MKLGKASWSLITAALLFSIVALGLLASTRASAAPPANGLLVEQFNNIEGTAVEDLTGSANYPDSPDQAAYLPTFETPTNVLDNYGVRVRGYVTAPATGDYVFTIASDDFSELWLSTDETPAKAELIATVPGWTNSREWEKYPEQASSPITLQQGKKYYIEALMKEGGGGDNLAVKWALPDGTEEAPIPNNRLTPWLGGEPPPAITDLAVAGSTDSSVSLSWTSPGGKAYMVRYALVPITPDNIASAKVASGAPKPAAKGTKETFEVKGLDALQAYYFAVQGYDNAAVSDPSNVVSAETAAVTNPLAALPPLPRVVDKAVYYDANYATSWTPDAQARMVRDFFTGKGYTLVDAAGLADFMTAHVTSKTPSVVVFAQDSPPDTVIDISSGGVTEDNLLNDYMDAGGRVLWFSDIPFYYVAQSDGAGNLTTADNGSVTILGFSAGAGTRDINDTVRFTPIGIALGMTTTWSSVRPALASDVDVVLASAQGGAAAWIKFYPDKNGPGMFIRTLDVGSSINAGVLADAQKLAEMPPEGTEAPRGRLNGVIVGTDGKPVAGASVQIAPATGNPINLVTDSSGYYSAMLVGGPYTITAKGPTSANVLGTTGALGPVTVVENKVVNAPTGTLAPEALPTMPVVVDKAVYYDENYGTGWLSATAGQQIRDYFVDKGYTLVDAEGLKTFMESHVASKTPSAVVLARDWAPDTIIDISSGSIASKNLLTDYMAAGGRVIHYGDWPFYYIGRADGTNYNPGGAGGIAVLGFDVSGGTRDLANDTVQVTEVAQGMGLTSTWNSVRPVRPADVDIVLQSARGGAAGWLKFWPDNTSPGFFARLVDVGMASAEEAQMADGKALAEFSGTIKVPGGVTPPPGVKGDVNGNGKLEITDVLFALRFAANLAAPTDAQKAIADVNANGRVDITDVLALLRAVAGIAPLP